MLLSDTAFFRGIANRLSSPIIYLFSWAKPWQAKVTDCEKISSMEVCANAPGCIYCLESPSFFNRRDLKSLIPNLKSLIPRNGNVIPLPTAGVCTSGSVTNQCKWFSNKKARTDKSPAQKLLFSRCIIHITLILWFFLYFQY